MHTPLSGPKDNCSSTNPEVHFDSSVMSVFSESPTGRNGASSTNPRTCFRWVRMYLRPCKTRTYGSVFLQGVVERHRGDSGGVPEGWNSLFHLGRGLFSLSCSGKPDFMGTAGIRGTAS